MQQNPLEIRRYPNRRLYDPSQGRYIKLDDIYALLQRGIRFTIIDQFNGTDCTHRVIIDLLLRRESTLSGQQPQLLTTDFIELLIRLAESERAVLVAKFLDHTVGTLIGDAPPVAITTKALPTTPNTHELAGDHPVDPHAR